MLRVSQCTSFAALALAAFTSTASAMGGPAPGAVTAETVKLPSGPGSVRGLADNANVDAFSGQVQYSVPIELPKWTGGFAPSLSLGYDGALGNGPLGVGWSMSQPGIRRSLRLGVPSYDASDELELVGLGNGMQLVPIGNGEYRVEGQGHSYVGRAVDGGFELLSPDGIVYRFGTIAASRKANGAKVAFWYLDEVRNTNGQSISYRYHEHLGELYLDAIEWGPSIAGIRAFRAEMVYGSRADAVVSYRTGFRVESAQRLDLIRIWSFGSVQRQVVLHYDNTFPLTRIDRVRVTGANGVDALPEVSFTYASTSSATVTPVSDMTGWGLNLQGTSLFDVDGDGATDLMRLTSAGHSYRRNLGGTFGPPQTITGAPGATLGNVRLLDLSGDSTAELVWQQGSQWVTYRLDGTSTKSWTSLGSWPGATNVNLSTVAIADLNGDNIMDGVAMAGGAMRVWMGAPTGLQAPVLRGAIDPARRFIQPGNTSTSLQDINGDGLADVVYLASSSMYLYLGRGDGTFEKYRDVAYPWTGSVLPSQIQLGDVNRDGLLDLVVVRGGNVAWHRGLPNGAVETTPIELARPAGTDGSVVVALADANGNGSLDIVWSSDAGMWIVDMAGPTSAGMLTAVDNGLGQKQRFDYQASSTLAFDAEANGAPWAMTMPLSIPVTVQQRVELASGEPARTTRLDVRDGTYDRSERRFVGFLEAVTTSGEGPSATRRVQRFGAGLGMDRELRGLVTYERVESGSGVVYTETTHTRVAATVDGLSSTDARLRRALLTATETKYFEGVATPLSTRTEFTYDSEGREIEQRNLGRLDLTGDEKITHRQYTTGRSAQGIRDKVCEESVYDSTGELVTRTQTLYSDTLCDASDGRVRVSRGYLASEARWVTLVDTRYDEIGNPIQTTKDGVTRDLEYDENGLHPLAEIVHPDATRALRWQMTWNNTLGVPATLRDADGSETVSTYDGVGRPLSIAHAGALPHIHYRYSWTGPRPYAETYSYDGASSTIPALPDTWTTSSGWRHTVAVFNSAGDPLFSAMQLDTNRWLVSGRTERDERGHVIATAEAYEYSGDLAGLVGSALPSNAAVRTAAYDALDRVTLQILPTGATKATRYRAFEATATQSDLAPVTTMLDGLGRIRSSERTIDGITQGVAATYDAAGRITKLHITASNKPPIDHTFQYDTLGRAVAANDPDIGPRTLRYDDGGHLIAQTNGAGQTTMYTYDGAGRLASVLGSDGSLFRYHYDAPLDNAFEHTVGRLAWAEEPTGRVELGYDADGRETRHRRTVDGRTADLDKLYGASGLLLQTDDGDGLTIAYQYDPAGRLVRAGDLLQVELMDAAGRPLRELYGNGVRQSYERDELGQPSRVTIARQGGALYDVQIDRNAYGAIESVHDQDGVGLDHSASFAYDGGARLTQAAIGTGASTYQFAYQYDGFQNMLRREAHGPTSLGILVGQYAYGEASHGPRQLTSITPDTGAPTTFDYDAAGRTVRQGDRVLTYNGFDQLVRVARGGDVLEHAYGYDGLRVHTRAVDGSEQFWFDEETSERAGGIRDHDIRIGDRLIARITRNPQLALAHKRATMTARLDTVTHGIQLSFAFGGCVLVLVACAGRRRGRRWRVVASIMIVTFVSTGCSTPATQQRSSLSTTSQVLFYHAGVGVGPALITRADGTVFDERRYEPFGTGIDAYRETSSGSTVGAVDFKYDAHNSLNKLTDADSGWSDHGARWMAPETGRWLTPDPPVKAPDPKFMAKPWGLHPYQYVDQNPIVFWDPDGKQPAGQVTKPSAPSPTPLEETGSWFDTAINMGQQYKLNAQAVAILGPYFKREFGFDVTKVRFEFGGTLSYTKINGADAFTIGNDILIDSDAWDSMKNPRDRFLLLVHEITHCVQYEQEGNTGLFSSISLFKFGIRYIPEYSRDDNYSTKNLQNVHVDKSNVTSDRWTYDQIAERVKEEVGQLIAP